MDKLHVSSITAHILRLNSTQLNKISLNRDFRKMSFLEIAGVGVFCDKFQMGQEVKKV